tara:strand:- start:264 stop:650 length:387 start_codon:yes stop_codon:yes gene_type:complete
MSKLIIDAAKEKIFFMIIKDNIYYNISYENSKNNYEKMVDYIKKFLKTRNLTLNNISKIYVNRGPGSFAGIRNSLSVVKAIHLVNKVDYYCFSFSDFKSENNVKYENIPFLCEKFKVKKNLINPIYLS